MLKRIERKTQLVAYKGGKCHDCGGIFPNCCFQFDHLDPDTKLFTISQGLNKRLAELMIEVDKCDMVCANCHAIRTAGNPKIAAKIVAAWVERKASRTNKPLSQETKAKMSETQTGCKRSSEMRHKLSEAKKGIQTTGMLGRRHSPETIAKMRQKAILREQRHREQRNSH